MILFLLQSPVKPHQWITQSKQCSGCWVGGSRKMDQRHHLSATTWWRLVWSLMYQNYIMVQYRLPTLRAGETSWLDRWTQPLRQNLWRSLRPSDWGEGCNLRQASSMGVWPAAVVWQWWHYMLTALNPPWYPKVAVHALSRFRDMLVNGVPRAISSKSLATWFLFTDASHEPQAAVPFSGVGGVLVDQLGCRRRFFSERMPQELLQEINVSQRKTIIFECEFFSVLCAMIVWKEISTSIQWKNFYINTMLWSIPAMMLWEMLSSLATPAAGTPFLYLIAILKAENEAECNSWITRVPTESNISDDPSLLQIDYLLSCGCLRDNIDCAEFWSNFVCKSGRDLERGGDRPAMHTPLDKRPHCKRGSSQQNLGKQDNGKRSKFWCAVMNQPSSGLQVWTSNMWTWNNGFFLGDNGRNFIHVVFLCETFSRPPSATLVGGVCQTQSLATDQPSRI